MAWVWQHADCGWPSSACRCHIDGLSISFVQQSDVSLEYRQASSVTLDPQHLEDQIVSQASCLDRTDSTSHAGKRQSISYSTAGCALDDPSLDPKSIVLESQYLQIIPVATRYGGKRRPQPYAVRLQVGQALSKVWRIAITEGHEKAEGQVLRVHLDFDESQPYRFPPLQPDADMHVVRKMYCSEAVLRAETLTEALRKAKAGRNYDNTLARWELTSLDRKVLELALNTIAQGAFPNACSQPWPSFKASCQLWAESGRWQDQKDRLAVRFRRFCEKKARKG